MTLRQQLDKARANFKRQEILISHTVGKVYVKPAMVDGRTTIHAHESAAVHWSGDYTIARGRLVLVRMNGHTAPPAELAFSFADLGIIRRYLTGISPSKEKAL